MVSRFFTCPSYVNFEILLMGTTMNSELIRKSATFLFELRMEME